MIAATLSMLLVLPQGDDPKAPAPEPGRRVTIVGSDTVLGLAAAWSDAYAKAEPRVSIAVAGGGTGHGIAQLLAGKVDLAMATRRLSTAEQKRADDAKLVLREHVVAFQALSVCVAKDSPVMSLTLEQLVQIFGDGGVRTWSELAVHQEAKRDAIRVLHRPRAGDDSLLTAMLGCKVRADAEAPAGTAELTRILASSPDAIACLRVAAVTDELRVVPVHRRVTEKALLPTAATVAGGRYPLAQPVLLYARAEPPRDIAKLLQWIGKEGQALSLTRGFLPAMAPVEPPTKGRDK